MFHRLQIFLKVPNDENIVQMNPDIQTISFAPIWWNKFLYPTISTWREMFFKEITGTWLVLVFKYIVDIVPLQVTNNIYEQNVSIPMFKKL